VIHKGNTEPTLQPYTTLLIFNESALTIYPLSGFIQNRMKAIVSICGAVVIAASASTLSSPEKVATIVDRKPLAAVEIPETSQHVNPPANDRIQAEIRDASKPRSYIGTTALTNSAIAQISDGSAIFGLLGAAALLRTVLHRRFWIGKRRS